MTDKLEEFKEFLKAELQRIFAEEMDRPPPNPGEITETIVRSLYPTARDIDSVAYIDDDNVLHALAWARVDPPREHIEIKIVPHD